MDMKKRSFKKLITLSLTLAMLTGVAGNPHSGRFQCVEYDFGENLLSVSAK